MYDYGYSYGYGLVGGNTYNPLINYDWSATTTSGLRYLKDVGSTPTYNASMYFGRGAYFNGVDQTIPINTISLAGDYTISFTSNTDGLNQRILFGTNVGIANFIRFEATSITYRVNSIEYSFPFLGSANTIASYVFKRVGTLTTLYINGVSIVSKTIPISTIIFDKVGTSSGIQYFNGTLKDVYMFNRALNQSEITQSYEQPEAFYAMAQADSTCVLNMPMCETDGYVRDMANYSEGSEEFQFNTWTMYGNNTQVDNGDGTYTITVVDDAKGGYMRHRNIINGDVYMTTITDVVYSEPITNELIEGYTGTVAFQEAIGDLKHVINASSTICYIYFKNLKIGSTVTARIKTVKLSGIYPITNYTSSVRDNAKNLQYGLQTCKFVRDSLGVIQSASDYLECDKVGYADTGWMPSASEDWTIECIAELGTTSSGFVFGFNKISQVNDRIRFVSEGAINFISCFNGFSKTASGYTGLTGIVLRFNKSTGIVDLFMNKIFHSTSSVIPISSGLSIFLAARNYNGTTVDNHYNKQIAKFKVHNKALTNEEIQAL